MYTPRPPMDRSRSAEYPTWERTAFAARNERVVGVTDITNGTNLCSICYSYSVYWGLSGTGIPIYNNKWLDNTRDNI